MNKTKSKVLSLILASAMIVSSFSSLNFASAASSRETGKLELSGGYLNSDDELYLVSSDDGTKSGIDLSTLIGSASIETYDRDDAGAAEYDSYNHVSGDKLVTINKDGDLTVKKGASGKEVISVTYEVEDYDRDDKEVTVKASKQITVFADVENEVFLGEAGKITGSATSVSKRPGDISTAAVNEKYVDVEAYYTVPSEENAVVAKYVKATGLTENYLADTTSEVATEAIENLLPAKDTTGLVGKTPSQVSAKNYALGATLPTLGTDEEYYVATADAATYTWKAVVVDEDSDNKADKEFENIVEKDTDVAPTGTPEAENAITLAKDATTDSAKFYFQATANATTYTWNVLDSSKHTTGKKLNSSALDLKGSKIFTGIAIKGFGDNTLADNVIRLYTKFVAESATKDADLAKTGSDTLKIKLGKYDDTQALDYKIDTSTTNIKVEVAKKWNADVDLTSGVASATNDWDIFKKNGKTYIAKKDFDYEDKDTWKDHKDEAESVGSYSEIFSNNSIKVLGGSVDALKVPADKTITVEDGTVGDIKAGTVDIQGGTVGTIKDRAETITISDGKVKAIDADNAALTITGGTISGNVLVKSADIDADDDDVDTVINGNVTVSDKDDDASIIIDSSSDASVTITGTLKNEADKGIIEINGENVTLGVVDGDYASSITFKDFTGKIKGIAGASEQTVTLEGESKFALTNKLVADTVDIDEDSRLEVADARVGSIEGEGRFAFPAGNLFVEDGIDGDVVLEITNGLVADATAFQSYEGAVDGSDVTGLGFSLETKSVNKTTDKHVIKNVTFAGPKFDKSDLTIAKGQTATVTVANYPDGTALPSGTSIAYDVDVNDDYISVTQEGNVLTIKALDFNADRSIDNKGTVTAYVVDANGDELEDYAEATVNVNIIEKPQSTVTLDTTKPVTVGTGAVYQYIAKSSTGAVMSAASSDTQVATVELFNAADPRGYKFQVKGLAVGTATITTTDANGATATLTVNVTKVEGTLKADTTTYTFAPGKVYDVKFSTTGTTAVPVVTVNGKVVSIAPRGNGVYRVTAQNPGTAFVVATVGNTHVSVKFVVANGAASVGVKGNNVSTLK